MSKRFLEVNWGFEQGGPGKLLVGPSDEVLVRLKLRKEGEHKQKMSGDRWSKLLGGGL